MQYQQTNKDDANLIKELKDADGEVQVRVAVNLAKIGRWDIINEANITGLNERISGDPEFQKFIAKKQDEMNGNLDDPDVRGEAKKLWEGNKSTRDKFNNDFETYFAYCRAVGSGQAKVIIC